mmetsp:Transcript_97027/g.274159  ORF Transcript_97027/g.274159 Transcript_97027/m.274159 type:complete len:453 (-) Transcript_97027:78-1436(-)
MVSLRALAESARRPFLPALIFAVALAPPHLVAAAVGRLTRSDGTRVPLAPAFVQIEVNTTPVSFESLLRATAGKAQGVSAGRAGPRRPLGQHGIVHFLFMVGDSVPLMRFWSAFFNPAPRESWRAWVHSSDNVTLDLPPGFQQVPTVASRYCRDLVSPMAQLTKVALESNPGSGGNDKFAFVSESTLPIKPFDVVHREFTATNNSDVGISDPRGCTGMYRGTDFVLVKTSQWIVLNRRHAGLLARNWVPVEDEPPYWKFPFSTNGGMEVDQAAGMVPADALDCPRRPIPGDRVPLSFRAQASVVGYEQRFLLRRSSRISMGCTMTTDEYAIFPTIFGAVVDDASGQIDIPDLGTIDFRRDVGEPTRQGQWRTFVTFNDSSYADPELEDPDTVAQRSPGHPWEFTRLGERTAYAMRMSEFFFARKFAPNVEIPDYSRIVIAPTGMTQENGTAA